MIGFVLVLAQVMAPSQTVACGVERWSVKTLADKDATDLVKEPPKATAIRTLIAMKAPLRSELLHAPDRLPSETATGHIRVPALIVGFKRETDSDIHIVIADPQAPTSTMIAEIPDAYCVPVEYQAVFNALQARFVTEFGRPRPQFHALVKPKLVTIDGIFFFDFLHGQRGVAPNGAEIHPVLNWIEKEGK